MELGPSVGIMNTEGKIAELPEEFRETLYTLANQLDLEAADKLRAEEKYGVYEFDEAPGVGMVVTDTQIVALVRMAVYDKETESMTDETKIVTIGIPRNDIEGALL